MLEGARLFISRKKPPNLSKRKLIFNFFQEFPSPLQQLCNLLRSRELICRRNASLLILNPQYLCVGLTSLSLQLLLVVQTPAPGYLAGKVLPLFHTSSNARLRNFSRHSYLSHRVDHGLLPVRRDPSMRTLACERKK